MPSSQSSCLPTSGNPIICDNPRSHHLQEDTTYQSIAAGVDFQRAARVSVLSAAAVLEHAQRCQLLRHVGFRRAFTKSVYVSNQMGWLSVLDEDENNVVTIQLGGGPNISEPEGVAVDPITNRAYVANFEPEGSVWVVDGRSNTLVMTVPVSDSPFGIAVNLLTRRVYAANSCEAGLVVRSCPNIVSVIDERTNRVIASVMSRK
jgi:YVTN family beta-propeller protein